MARSWDDDPFLSEDIPAVRSVESGGTPDPNVAVSPKGARGPMQVMDATARKPGYGVVPARDDSVEERVRVGEDYISALQQRYGREGGLQAYNAGPGTYEKAKATGTSLPAETVAYVPKVNSAGKKSNLPRSTSSWDNDPLVDSEATSDTGSSSSGYDPEGNFRVEIRGVGDEGKTEPNTQVEPPKYNPEEDTVAGRIGATVDMAKAAGGYLKDAAGDAPANLASGFGDVGSAILRYTADPLIDKAKGQPVGTSSKERRADIEAFNKQNTSAPDNLVGHLTRAIPEALATAGPIAKVAKVVGGGLAALPFVSKGVGLVGGNAIANAGYEGGKVIADRVADEGWSPEMLKDARNQAMLGGAFSLGGEAIGKAITGSRPTLSAGLKQASDLGYVPTIGQQTGSIGRAAENYMQSNTIVGGGIKRGQAGAEETISRAEANRVLEPIGKRTEKTGAEAVQEMKDHISDAYNEVKQHVEIKPLSALNAVHQANAEIQAKLRKLSPQAQAEVFDFVKRRVTTRSGRVKNIDGADWKNGIDDELGKEAWRLKKSMDPDQINKGDALLIYQKHLRDAVRAKPGAPADSVRRLRTVDAAFRQSLAVREASKKAIDEGGAFGAKKFAQAADRKLGEGNRGPLNSDMIAERTGGEVTPSQPGVVTGAKYAAGAAGITAAAKGLTAAGIPAPVVAAGAAGGITGIWALSHAVNSEVGRKAMLNGLSGLVPTEFIGKLRGMAPGEQSKALREFIGDPAFQSVVTQLASKFGMQNKEYRDAQRR